MDVLPTYQSAQVPTTSETPAQTPSTPSEQQPIPSEAEAAKAKRAELIADPKFRERYLAGDVAARNELKGYNVAISGANTAQRTEAVLAGALASNQMEVTTDEDFLTTSQLASEAKHLLKWFTQPTPEPSWPGMPP